MSISKQTMKDQRKEKWLWSYRKKFEQVLYRKRVGFLCESIVFSIMCYNWYDMQDFIICK